MHSHNWNCTNTHNQWDCPTAYPISNVRVITSFEQHAQQAMDLANSGRLDAYLDALDASIARHPAGKQR
jgi:hypothetical protein